MPLCCAVVRCVAQHVLFPSAKLHRTKTTTTTTPANCECTCATPIVYYILQHVRDQCSHHAKRASACFGSALEPGNQPRSLLSHQHRRCCRPHVRHIAHGGGGAEVEIRVGELAHERKNVCAPPPRRRHRVCCAVRAMLLARRALGLACWRLQSSTLLRRAAAPPRRIADDAVCLFNECARTPQFVLLSSCACAC